VRRLGPLTQFKALTGAGIMRVKKNYLILLAAAWAAGVFTTLDYSPKYPAGLVAISAAAEPGNNSPSPPVLSRPPVSTGAGDRRNGAAVNVLGRRIPNFVLPDAGGKEVGLDDFADRKCLIVVFLGTSCPIGNGYLPVLNGLRKQYARQAEIIGIYANPADDAEAVRKHAKEYRIDFPVLIDTAQTTLPMFDAKRVAEVFLLDWRRDVVYRGRIDDRFGYDYKRDAPRRDDLRQAMEEMLAGKKITVPATEPAGCVISRLKTARAVRATYAKDVAPILNRNCAACHHPGTSAPFSLLTYDDAKSWSGMIREVVSQRRMPPWRADPRFGHFDNERRLTAEEIDTLSHWADDGAPLGNRKDIPPAPAFESGWRIGKPDAVFRMPEEVTVPATGTVAYKYFKTPTNFKEDVWVQAAEARPGCAAVHHIIIFYRDKRGASKEPVWIMATAPGADTTCFPKGLGRKIPAGAELVWQVHYTPTGKEEKDRSEVGFVFCKEPPKHNVRNYGIANSWFHIPPGEPNREVVSTVPAIKNTVILSLFPHMHLRGKDFLYEVIYPDKHKETLLSVPQYDFNWQSTYRLREPLHVPQGSIIRCVAHYDNSPANPANPDPKKDVRWGDQTWEEMMIGYVDYYWEDEKVK
jgi:peroxiredoxin